MTQRLSLLFTIALASAAISQATLIEPTTNITITHCIYCTQYNTENVAITTFGNLSMYGATGTSTADPYAGIMAQASGTTDGELSGATGQVNYFLRVNGPGQAPLNVLVSFNLIVQATGGGGYGRATAGITVDGYTSNSAVLDCFNECSSQALHSGFSVTGIPGTEIGVRISALAESLSGGSGYAFADPLFSIDPLTPNASLYSIEMSPGIANALGPGPAAATPEPGSVALMGIGVAALTMGRKWAVRIVRG